MFRLVSGGILALVLVIGASAAAPAAGRMEPIQYIRNQPCGDGRSIVTLCKGDRELLPCDRIAVPETPCRPVKSCWIEPWMCGDRNAGTPERGENEPIK